MLDSLSRIVHEVNQATSQEDALALIVSRVKAALQADVCSVYLTDPETGEHVLMATDGLKRSAVGKVRMPAKRGLIGLVAKRAELVNVEDAQKHPQFLFIASTGEAPFHGFLGAPIVRRRKDLGVLVVQQRLVRRYTGEEESFLATLAAQLAASINQAEIRESLNRLDDRSVETSVFLDGVASAKGLGIGRAVVLYPEAALEAVPDKTIADDAIPQEIAHFEAAVTAEVAELSELGQRMGKLLAASDRALFDAYSLILRSDSLTDGVISRIRAGNWAPGAVRVTALEYANAFEGMEDEYLRERMADIRDLCQRLIKRLLQMEHQVREYPEHTVLMGEEISVTQFLEVDPRKLAGLVSVRGTGASHVALLARGLGIPAVFGVNDAPLPRLNGREIVVDGYMARVCIQPAPALRQAYQRLADEEAELSRDLQELKHLPSETPDGHHVALLANSGLTADVAAARESGAEGLGLYRSELHFFMRDRFPSEDEQTAIYAEVLNTMAPLPVTLRTLDIGGDKPLSYFPIEEQNPFLGWRGIRISLDQIDIFKTQLRAMLRAGGHSLHLAIMFPMVTTLKELDDAIALVHEAREELLEDGLAVPLPRLGVMVEVPSLLYQIPAVCQRVDFISVGSNDLTQYLLAVDRNNPRVAKLYDGAHPAVITAVCRLVEDAHAVGKSVSICGEMAGDPALALLLMAAGADGLSMSLGNLLKVKWTIRTVPFAVAQTCLAAALVAADAPEVRGQLNAVLDQYGLGGLIRAGKS